uniref:Uncharacterized protein n=1 Tax=Physcomitrium patens TaxID=3218 RepID=A0A7I4CWC1_PHYPA
MSFADRRFHVIGIHQRGGVCANGGWGKVK